MASKEMVFPTGATVTWDNFVKAFFEKYFSDCSRDKKMMEFMQFKQNDLMMDQYEAKFIDLSRFGPRLVEDREDKAKRFWDGLRQDIRRKLVPLNLKDYNDLYEHAQLVEKDLTELATTTFQHGRTIKPFELTFAETTGPCKLESSCLFRIEK